MKDVACLVIGQQERFPTNRPVKEQRIKSPCVNGSISLPLISVTYGLPSSYA